jgi:hypothetical protein
VCSIIESSPSPTQATEPYFDSATVSPSETSPIRAPPSSPTTAIVLGGLAVTIGERLEASCAPIARVKPRAKLGADWTSASNSVRPSSSNSAPRLARTEADRVP